MSRNQTDRLTGSQVLQTSDRWTVGNSPGLHLDECRDSSPLSSFGALVSSTARRAQVEHRALAIRTLLHLPRVASKTGWVSRGQAKQQLRVSARRLRRDLRAAQDHVPAAEFSLCELEFEVIESKRAVPVLAALHYLRSARPGSLHFALVDPIDRHPVSLCSLSPLQWKCVAREIRARFAIPSQHVLDVSRVYSVDNAPANAISSLLSRVRTYLRQNLPSIDLLITAVDPNLGFTGSSYRAANWQHWMSVKPRPYLYESGHYVSPRQLHERYGTANLGKLRAKYPGRFQQSRVKLLDSMIFCNKVNGETKVVLAQERRRLHR
jgi:hypothetical protein